MAEQRVTYCSTEEGGRSECGLLPGEGRAKKLREGGREEAAVQCKNSMVVKGGRMARKERGEGGEEASNTHSSPSALFSHYCLFSLKFLSLLVKMPTRFSVSVLLNQ